MARGARCARIARKRAAERRSSPENQGNEAEKARPHRPKTAIRPLAPPSAQKSPVLRGVQLVFSLVVRQRGERLTCQDTEHQHRVPRAGVRRGCGRRAAGRPPAPRGTPQNPPPRAAVPMDRPRPTATASAPRSCLGIGSNSRTAFSGHVDVSLIGRRGQGLRARWSERGSPTRRPCACRFARRREGPRATWARSRRRAARSGS